jgi:hypothetical protein
MDTNRHLQAFELLLKKCANIAFIDGKYDYDMSDSMLSLITKHCNHLNGIYMCVEENTTNETINEFFAKFAKQLQSLEWDDLLNTSTEGYILNNIKCCPNLRELYLGYEGNQLSHVLSGDRNEVLFHRFHTLRVIYNNDYHNTFVQFVDTYKHSMKSIHVQIYRDYDNTTIAAVMTGLSQMWALIDLKIVYPNHYTDVMNHHLRQIGVNCPQIRRLALEISLVRDDPYDEFIAALNDSFKRVKRLQIDGTFFAHLCDRRVNPCKRVTHLKLRPLYYEYLNDNHSDHFIETLNTVFPNIVSLDVSDVGVIRNGVAIIGETPKTSTHQA